MAEPVFNLSASELAERTGKSARYFQRLAAEKKLAWASQPQGHGTAWMFNEAGFQRWLINGCKVGGAWRVTPADEPKVDRAALREHLLTLCGDSRLGEQGFVYFAGVGDRVKIGWAKEPTLRLGEIKTHNSGRVTLLLKIAGSRRDEHALHERFAPYRIRGEWFRKPGPIADFIQERSRG